MSDQPPSYLSSSDGDQILPNMYTATMTNNQILVLMKEDYIEMFRDTTTKIISYTGDIKKEQNMNNDEYSEYIARIQLRIDEQEYKLLSVDLDTCEIQIFVETYFKLKVSLESFIPTTLSNHAEHASSSSDLLLLAYVAPIHKSLKHLIISNIMPSQFTSNLKWSECNKTCIYTQQVQLINPPHTSTTLPRISTMNQYIKHEPLKPQNGDYYCNRDSIVVNNTVLSYTTNPYATTIIRRINTLNQIDHESAILIYFNDSKFSFISQLVELEELILYDVDLNVLNLSRNKKLKRVTIVAPDLKELNTLRNHPNLEFIDIYETSITDYSFLSACHKLKKLVPSHMAQASKSFPSGVKILSYDNPKYWIDS